MQVDREKLLIGSEEGKSVRFGGSHVVYKLSHEATRGAFSIVEHLMDPGTLVMPHVHTREDEFMYVLEGEIGVRVGNEVFRATRGCFVSKPRNIPHTFWNSGREVARSLEILSPPGVEKIIEELAELVRQAPQGVREELSRLNSRYGLSDVGDWVPELTAKYKVRLNAPITGRTPKS